MYVQLLCHEKVIDFPNKTSNTITVRNVKLLVFFSIHTYTSESWVILFCWFVNERWSVSEASLILASYKSVGAPKSQKKNTYLLYPAMQIVLVLFAHILFFESVF